MYLLFMQQANCALYILRNLVAAFPLHADFHSRLAGLTVFSQRDSLKKHELAKGTGQQDTFSAFNRGRFSRMIFKV
jgi:hypothetical protein